MLARISRACFSQGKIEISLGEGSNLKHLVKLSKGHREANWRVKMCAEWMGCAVVAAVTMNIVYNSYP